MHLDRRVRPNIRQTQSRIIHQQRRHLSASLTVVQTCYVLNESKIQSTDPTGGSENEAMTNKVCAVTMSLALRRPPSSTPRFVVTALSILRGFVLENLAHELLQEDGVHGPGNLLSLEPTTYIYFDNLDLCFEATDKVHHLLAC